MTTIKHKISLLEKASRIMVLAHDGQKRKTNNLPYVVHPIITALQLEKFNFPEEVIAAALVHDVLEDTKFPPKQLRKELGQKVWQIVKAVSENKSLPWEERKTKYIKTIRRASVGIKAVSISDKINNVESLLEAHQELGTKLWLRFNRGRDQQIWFHNTMLKALQETWNHPLVKVYEKLVKKLHKLK